MIIRDYRTKLAYESYTFQPLMSVFLFFSHYNIITDSHKHWQTGHFTRLWYPTIQYSASDRGVVRDLRVS